MTLLQAAEVAERLGVDVSRVYALTREGILPVGEVVVHLGRQKRYREDGLDAWIKSGGQTLPGGWKRDAS